MSERDDDVKVRVVPDAAISVVLPDGSEVGLDGEPVKAVGPQRRQPMTAGEFFYQNLRDYYEGAFWNARWPGPGSETKKGSAPMHQEPTPVPRIVD